MIQFGNPVGQPAPYQYASQPQNQGGGGHQTQNPTAAVSGGYVASAFAIAPVALVPAYMMAYPQMMATGMPMAGTGMAGPSMAGGMANSGAEGQHVTANPTNAIAQDQSGFHFGGASMGGMYGMPVMMSPMFVAFGFPVFGYAAAPGGQPPAELSEPVDVPDVVEPDVIDDVVTAPVPDVEVPVEGPVIDVVPPVNTDPDPGPSLPNLPVEVSADEFSKYRMIETSKKMETNLEFSLKTQEGDEITLSFNQLDVQEMSRFGGKTLEGQRIRDFDFNESSERLVNMDVAGELDADEYAAVQSVLSSVVEAVQSFFTGDMMSAMSKLKAMDFDSSELAELSLNMSMSKSAEITKGYHNGDDRMHDLRNRDADVVNALEFMANEQKRLIDVASEVLEMPSAVKMVKALIPPMMSEPFAELRDEIQSAKEVVESDDDAVVSDEAENGDDD